MEKEEGVANKEEGREGASKVHKMAQGQKVMSTLICTLTHLHWFHTQGSWPPVLSWHCS